MAFRSYDELINMSAKDPEQAREYVAKAKMGNNPVISRGNSGYGNNTGQDPVDYRKAAINRRMKANKKPVDKPQEDAVTVDRKKFGY